MAYFNFENKKIYYKIVGTGEPLLLLAGNTASSKMFGTLVSKYSKDYRLILIDFPGHGKSERVETFETDFWFYNSQVCYSLIETLNIEKISVVGTSGGALVGINLAMEHPDRIKYLFADSFEGEYPLQSYIGTLRADREKGKRKIFSAIFWFINHGLDWKHIVDLDTEMILRFYATGQSFFHRSISELIVPTLITGSRKDEFCNNLEDIYRELKKKNDRLEIILFDSGNHPAMISNRDLFYNLIRERVK
ncbi:MAG: alpha/beta hydrolase [Bacteroidales bacterium]|nr:alpha/beta hydrolase [Bacteroidales bacterium]MDD4712969.1 alpha/beta hydrolase [Bacteroidales bacterium]